MTRLLGLFLLLATLTGCADMKNPWTQNAAAAPPAVQGPASAITTPALAAPSPATTAPKAKVALLLPLSGKNAALGQAMLQAAQLAVFDMGATSFQLMPTDSKATPEGARVAAETALNNGAQLILGPLFSTEVKAVKPLADAHNVNVVTFSTDWTQGGSNVFVMGFIPFSQVQRIVAYASAKGHHRIGLVAPQGDYGNAVAGYFQSLASKYNLAAAPVNRIGTGSIAQSFAPGGAPAVDAVLIAVGGAQASAVAAQLTQAGLAPDKVKRLGTGLWDDSAALAADPNLRGAWYAAPQPDMRRGFEKKYMDTYGQPAPRLATLAYDATALAAVLARGNGALFDRAALTNANGFAGIDGIFRFQSNGLIERGMAVMQMENGTVTVADPAPATFQRMAY